MILCGRSGRRGRGKSRGAGVKLPRPLGEGWGEGRLLPRPPGEGWGEGRLLPRPLREGLIYFMGIAVCEETEFENGV